MKIKDLTGQRFNRLTPIKISHRDKYRSIHWLCKCDCGNFITVHSRDIQNGHTKSCGCLRIIADKTKRFKDLTGQKFNKLTVIKKVGIRIGNVDSRGFTRKNALWECICECGNKINVVANALISNNTKSCGCLQHPSGENSPVWNHNLTQEERVRGRKFPEYYLWRDAVYIRDNYTCQITGKTNQILNAHHLYGYTANPTLRIEIDNGITLCESIHVFFHHLYGKGKNTPEQFNEFKNRYQSGEWRDYQI
jgi:hypothetical protein